MTANKRYYRDVKKLFPVYLKKEKLYLKQLKEQINEYEDTSYEELIDIFGEPIDIVKAYYDTINSKYLLKRMNLKRIVTITCIFVLTLTTLYLGYRIYILSETINEYYSSIPFEIEETIEVSE